MGAVEDVGFDAELAGHREASSLLLRVGGMTCTACAAGVEAVLKAQQGVMEVAVDFLSGRTEVRRDEADVLRRAASRQSKGEPRKSRPFSSPSPPPCPLTQLVLGSSKLGDALDLKFQQGFNQLEDDLLPFGIRHVYAMLCSTRRSLLLGLG